MGISVPCKVKQHAGFSVQWLPLLGPTDEVQLCQAPYVRVLPLNGGEVSKHLLPIVQSELEAKRLNYVVMVCSKTVKGFEKTAAVVKPEDRNALLKCVSGLLPTAQDQPASFTQKLCKYSQCCLHIL